MTPGGFPHSEICGSKAMCASPQLIAACHVLHRLLMPRHPPCALNIFILLFLNKVFGYAICLATHRFVIIRDRDYELVFSRIEKLLNLLNAMQLSRCAEGFVKPNLTLGLTEP